MQQGKIEAYFNMSYNQPPNKSVVNDVMHTLSVIITEEHAVYILSRRSYSIHHYIHTEGRESHKSTLFTHIA